MIEWLIRDRNAWSSAEDEIDPEDEDGRQEWFRSMWEGGGGREQVGQPEADITQEAEDEQEDDDFGDDFDDFAEGDGDEDFGDFDQPQASPPSQPPQPSILSHTVPDVLADLVSSLANDDNILPLVVHSYCSLLRPNG